MRRNGLRSLRQDIGEALEASALDDPEFALPAGLSNPLIEAVWPSLPGPKIR